jgi:hypothetical protein
VFCFLVSKPGKPSGLCSAGLLDVTTSLFEVGQFSKGTEPCILLRSLNFILNECVGQYCCLVLTVGVWLKHHPCTYRTMNSPVR